MVRNRLRQGYKTNSKAPTVPRSTVSSTIVICKMCFNKVLNYKYEYFLKPSSQFRLDQCCSTILVVVLIHKIDLEHQCLFQLSKAAMQSTVVVYI